MNDEWVLTFAMWMTHQRAHARTPRNCQEQPEKAPVTGRCSSAPTQRARCSPCERRGAHGRRGISNAPQVLLRGKGPSPSSFSEAAAVRPHLQTSISKEILVFLRDHPSGHPLRAPAGCPDPATRCTRGCVRAATDSGRINVESLSMSRCLYTPSYPVADSRFSLAATACLAPPEV